MGQEAQTSPRRPPWGSLFSRKSGGEQDSREKTPSKWNLGILEDKETIEVPGTPLTLMLPNDPIS